MSKSQIRLDQLHANDLQQIQKDYVKKFKIKAPSINTLANLAVAHGKHSARKKLNLD